jgi:hypothetical protein
MVVLLCCMEAAAAVAAAARGSSSSSSQGQQQQQQSKQQLRADVLPIPAFHQDMLQLLPGGQAYLEASAKLAKTCKPSPDFLVHAGSCCYAMYRHLCLSFSKPADQQYAPALSAAAVRLVLELQLLAAAEHQRCDQQQQGDPAITAVLLSNSTRLLHTLIKAAAQASGSCLPPEVLQQAGLQLLQALAAPLQQLQLSQDVKLVNYAQTLSLNSASGHMGEACHALLTAVCGPGKAAVVERELPWFH